MVPNSSCITFRCLLYIFFIYIYNGFPCNKVSTRCYKIIIVLLFLLLLLQPIQPGQWTLSSLCRIFKNILKIFFLYRFLKALPHPVNIIDIISKDIDNILLIVCGLFPLLLMKRILLMENIALLLCQYIDNVRKLQQFIVHF